MMPYEKLQAWAKCHALALAVYDATKSFPRDERYGLTSQTRRAAFSAAANIAEGSAKRGTREFSRYLDIALGSLCELSYAFRFTRDAGILSRATYDRLEARRTEASKVTWGLYRAMRRRRLLPDIGR